MRRLLLLLALFSFACSDSTVGDASLADAAGSGDTGRHPDARVDAGFLDADPAPDVDVDPDADVAPDADAEVAPDAIADAEIVPDAAGDAEVSPDVEIDGGIEVDAGFPDATPADSGPTYNCGAFSTNPGWTVQPGFRAVTIATAAEGLNQPVAISFAGGAFGDRLFVVNQGNDTLVSIEVFTGTSSVVVGGAEWPVNPALLTTVSWDQLNIFDGNLYVGDQGSNSDGDSRIYRVTPSGVATTFAEAPGAAMDDLYALVFVPTSTSYAGGLYVAGDTDGAGPDWARIDAQGVETAFSEVAGIEGAVYDNTGAYGRRIIASRPLGGGYAGDGTITAIEPNGAAGRVLARNLGGVHAVVFSPGGTFGQFLYAASWSAGQLIRVAPSGMVDIVAGGLSLTEYDGNILAFSPDGNVLYVADRAANRVVCIEPL